MGVGGGGGMTITDRRAHVFDETRSFNSMKGSDPSEVSAPGLGNLSPPGSRS